MLRGWIIFHHELDPAIPEVPEVLRFQEAASAMGIDLTVHDPHRFDLIVGGDEDWAVTYNDSPMGRPDFIICRTGAETDYYTLALLRHFERRGARLVNGPATIERVADKLPHATKPEPGGSSDPAHNPRDFPYGRRSR
jgi:gamma-F420-2:alpha-L-glutamate ligase